MKRRAPADRYRRWLRLLPPALRDEAAGELTEMFVAAHARAVRRGRLAVVGLWMRAAADLILTGAAERRRSRRPHTTPQDRVSVASHFGRLLADLGAAARRQRGAPGSALFAASALALGIGAALAAFVLVRDVLVRPLPLPEPDRLVRLREVTETGGRFWPSFPNCADWEAANTGSFAAIGCGSIPTATVVDIGGTSVRADVARGTAGLFEALGVRPSMGRSFTGVEHRPGGPAVALASERFWKEALGSPTPGERVMTVGAERVTVVGVLPRDFRFLGDGNVWTQPDLWMPLEREANLGGRRSHGYHTIGRLRPGVTAADAEREMAALASRLKAEHHEGTHADRVETRPLADVVIGSARDPLALLAWAALAVLLVACLNFAATLFARGLSRTHELSVRLSLGAGRADLARLLIVESLLFAAPAALAGLGLAAASLRALTAWHPAMLPRIEAVRVDAGAALLAAALAVVAAFVAGALPSLVVSARAISRTLTARSDAGQSRHRRLWNLALALQVAAALILLIGSGLLIRSFQAALDVDLGYQSANVLAVPVALPEDRYPTPEARKQYVLAAIDRLTRLPSTAAASLTNALPHITQTMTSGTRRADSTEPAIFASQRVVTSAYFDVLGIPVLQRRDDMRGTGVYLDASLARRLSPDQPLPGASVRAGFSDEPLTVAGVVGAVREWNQDEGAIGAVYYDYESTAFDLSRPFFLVRHRGRAAQATRDVRDALAGIAAGLPVDIQPLDAEILDTLQDRRAVLEIVSAFGLIGLAIASVGVYALVAFAVGRRLREAAIRKALGARRSQIVLGMAGVGLVPTAAGLALGAAAWIPASRALRALLFQVTPYDPSVLLLSGASLALAAVLAGLIPARRAARVDPLVLLRDH